MFTVIAMVMTMQGPGALQDTRGPYDTMERCQERLVEMRTSMLRYGIVPVKIACVPNKKSDADETAV